MHPLNRPSALMVMAFAWPATAATPLPNFADEPVLVVTATRFAETESRAPANISVISRSDIANAPAKDVPGLLNAFAGISVRPLYGSLGIDAPIDLRGFGESGVSNTLILLDGQRLNPVDSGSVSWSAIPLEAIERIEIMRGAGTVLYGDRASGGVINIITDKSGKARASLAATIGSFASRGLDVSLAGGNERYYGNAFLHHAATDGWRQNSQAEQNALSGRVGQFAASTETFVDYAFYNDHNGLPGYQRTAAYLSRSTASRTPQDAQERQGYRLRPGVAIALAPKLRFEAEADIEQERLHSNYASFASIGERDHDTWSLTPRLTWQHGLGGLASETVVGLDHYVGKIEARYSNLANQGAKQTSSAFYLQNQTTLAAWTLTLGGRQQRLAQRIHQEAYAPFASPALDGNATRQRRAWDAGLAHSAENWRIYGKIGASYRFANTDELFAYDPMTGNPLFAGDLRPQQGRLKEIGGSFKLATVAGRMSLFRLDLRHEIGYDGNTFANVNFDPTRRQGVEAEIDWRLSERLKARLAYTHLDAEFRSGANAGKQLPLVAQDKGSLQLHWDGGQAGRYTAQLNAIGDRRYSGDASNSRKMLAGYETLDLLAAWNFKPWMLNLRVLNALDKRYAPYAGYAPSIADYYYYPGDRRAVFASARYDF